MIAEAISEKNFQELIVSLARNSGWLVFHTYDSRRCAPGFPDLVMVRGKHLIFAELKSQKGRLTAEQKQWLDRLWLSAEGLEVYLWRPSNWDDIEEVIIGEG